MKDNQAYIPVGCDFVDLIEIKATEGVLVDIKYENMEGIECRVNTRLKTWETRNKVEYLITKESLEIRLDDIISIDGISDGKTCIV